MKKLILLVLLLASPLLGQYVRYDNVVLDQSGQSVSNVFVAVCSQPASTGSQPCSPLVSLYSTPAGTSLSNPVQTDSTGNYLFYVRPGTYTIQLYGGGLSSTQTIADVTIGSSGPVIDYGGQVFNVKAYGAKGDGTTNDTTAVEAAIAAVCAASPVGGTIYFPAGTFLVDPLTELTHCLTQDAPQGTVTLRFVGAGVSATTIRAYTAGSMISKTGTGNTYFALDIENLTLDGNSQTGETGIQVQSTNELVIRNVKFENFDTYPISLQSVILGELDNVVVYDPVGSSADGIVIGPPSTSGTSTQITMTNVFVYGYSNGLYVPATGGGFGRLTLIDCAFNGQTVNGMDIQTGSELTIIGADVEEGTGGAHGLNLGDTSENASALVNWVSIIGGYYTASTASRYSINADSVHNITFGGGIKVAGNGLNLTNNATLISGALYAASLNGSLPSASSGRFRYSTDSNNWIYVNGPSSGKITLSSGSGSQSFTNVAYQVAPNCTVHDDTTPANTVTKTVTASSISLTGTGSDVISWVCNPAVN